MKVLLMPFIRQMKLNHVTKSLVPDVCNTRYCVCKHGECISLKDLDRLCAAAKCHPQDVIWGKEFPTIPEERTYEPLFKILEERNLSLVTLTTKFRSDWFFAFKFKRLHDYDICNIAYLLDVSPRDLVKEVK